MRERPLDSARGGELFFRPDDFLCYDDSVVFEQLVAAETLKRNEAMCLQELLAQACWSFWQAHEPFLAGRTSTQVSSADFAANGTASERVTGIKSESLTTFIGISNLGDNSGSS